MGICAEDDFRKAMRRLASAVTIVATAQDGRRHGMTATAVTSVSNNPPSLLICVNRAGRLHDPLLARAQFCVNILYGDQSEIAEAFSRSGAAEDRFASGEWGTSERGIPYLRESQANIFCDVDLVAPYGTHSIVVGKISELIVAGHVAPLLYQDGRYTVGLGEGIDWVVPL